MASPFWVIQIFPTQLLAFTRSDPPFGAWYEMRFDRPDFLDLHIHLLLEPEAAAEAGAVAYLRSSFDAVHREDIAVCEGIQRGLRSALWQPGLLSIQERCLVQFHRYLAERMGAAPPA